MKFSEIFKELCIENNTNPKQIARNLKIEDSTLYKYLSGTLPRVKNAVLLANYFNCSLNYLFGIDDIPNAVNFKKTFNLKLFFPRYEKLLKENNKTHFAFCKTAGLNFSNLYYWKHGRVPYFDILEKIARNLNCSIDYLVGRT